MVLCSHIVVFDFETLLCSMFCSSPGCSVRCSVRNQCCVGCSVRITEMLCSMFCSRWRCCFDGVRNFGTGSTFAVLFDVVFADVVVFDVLFGRER